MTEWPLLLCWFVCLSGCKGASLCFECFVYLFTSCLSGHADQRTTRVKVSQRADRSTLHKHIQIQSSRGRKESGWARKMPIGMNKWRNERDERMRTDGDGSQCVPLVINKAKKLIVPKTQRTWLGTRAPQENTYTIVHTLCPLLHCTNPPFLPCISSACTLPIPLCTSFQGFKVGLLSSTVFGVSDGVAEEWAAPTNSMWDVTKYRA